MPRAAAECTAELFLPLFIATHPYYLFFHFQSTLFMMSRMGASVCAAKNMWAKANTENSGLLLFLRCNRAVWMHCSINNRKQPLSAYIFFHLPLIKESHNIIPRIALTKWLLSLGNVPLIVHNCLLKDGVLCVSQCSCSSHRVNWMGHKML